MAGLGEPGGHFSSSPAVVGFLGRFSSNQSLLFFLENPRTSSEGCMRVVFSVDQSVSGQGSVGQSVASNFNTAPSSSLLNS